MLIIDCVKNGKDEMVRKAHPQIDTGVEPVKRGPRPPRSAFGTLAERCLVFTHDGGDSLTRDEIIGMLLYQAEHEASGAVTKWADAYNCNPNKQMHLENYCSLAEVSPNELFGIIAGIYEQACKMNARVTLTGRIGGVMDATLDFAETYPDNAKDREMALKMAEMPGLQPASININQNVQVNSLSSSGIPRFETSQLSMTQKVLKATEAKILSPAGAVIDVTPERKKVANGSNRETAS